MSCTIQNDEVQDISRKGEFDQESKNEIISSNKKPILDLDEHPTNKKEIKVLKEVGDDQDVKQNYSDAKNLEIEKFKNKVGPITKIDSKLSSGCIKVNFLIIISLVISTDINFK